MIEEKKCICAGGCCVNSLGYHPKGWSCTIGMTPGIPAKTVENHFSDPRKRLERAAIGLPPTTEEGKRQYAVAALCVENAIKTGAWG